MNLTSFLLSLIVLHSHDHAAILFFPLRLQAAGMKETHENKSSTGAFPMEDSPKPRLTETVSGAG